MKICVIHPGACSESARELAEALGCKSHLCQGNYLVNNRDVFVFNYGVGGYPDFVNKNVINKGDAVNSCVNKLHTFIIFKKANIPTVEYTLNPRVAKEWDTVVCHSVVGGRANEGVSYWYKGTRTNPKGQLFTKYFEHKYEYRIVVFKGKVVGRYRKDVALVNGVASWNFTLMTKQGFEDIDSSCLQAAGALQIDYVGFDVLENKKGAYVVLEANSGPILTEEAKKAIVKYFKGLKK